ncbi:hypothetical protein [Halomarina oriensis]|uniref:Uncharacterized protein n=1 Tax=Halomarina oriensis TaxID=671145 RepID=A0A6B0GHU9_9EURY|nr:hypothetical protein [Halomarina oriensis]MWG32999.1 hypothetical protein [Halomarina oriensis]
MFEESMADIMGRESIILTVIGFLLSVIALEPATSVGGVLGAYVAFMVFTLTIVLPLYVGYQIYEALEEGRSE